MQAECAKGHPAGILELYVHVIQGQFIMVGLKTPLAGSIKTHPQLDHLKHLALYTNFKNEDRIILK